MPRAVQTTPGHVSERGLARLRARYSHPADNDEKRYDKGGNLLIQPIGAQPMKREGK
jgi:hypothetical protein